jgi:uncharacterized membrane protein
MMNEILPGLKGMLNVHPLFVHFPIALWIGAMLVEALAVLRSSGDWHRTAARLLYLGTLFGLLAAATGLLAQNSVPDEGPAHDVLELHEKLMLVTTSAAVGLCMFAYFQRDRFAQGQRKLLLAGLLALTILLTIGADRGALLVFKYATSVHLPNAPR